MNGTIVGLNTMFGLSGLLAAPMMIAKINSTIGHSGTAIPIYIITFNIICIWIWFYLFNWNKRSWSIIETKIDIKNISTEGRNKNTLNIDKENSLGIIKLINKEDQTIAIAIEKVLPNISKVIDFAYETLLNEGRLFYIGAGTSGRLGVLDASEMPPTFNVSKDLIIGIIVGGDDALRNPIEGAEDSEIDSINDLKNYSFNKKDMLIGIAASGRIPYVISGLKYANEIGAKTASISTSINSKIGEIAKLLIDVNIGFEPITGSTRMKSGTAQKWY